MSTILSTSVIVIQILAFGLLAAIIPLLLSVIYKKKRVLIAVFLAALVLELAGAYALTQKPIWVCPPEYQDYISEESKLEIIGLNSGIYSSNIPVFPVCVRVKHADGEEIIVETRYLAFGCTKMSISKDGITSLSEFGF